MAGGGGEAVEGPAYVVLHDRTLAALARARPKNPRELLGIDGIGPAKVERFGKKFCACVRRNEFRCSENKLEPEL